MDEIQGKIFIQRKEVVWVGKVGQLQDVFYGQFFGGIFIIVKSLN